MNYSNEKQKVCKDAIKAEFGKKTNKELYAWLRTNYPTQPFLTGLTKDQLYNEIYVCRCCDDKISHAKERDELTAMGSNDRDAPADAETDAEEEDEEDVEVCNDCGCDLTDKHYSTCWVSGIMVCDECAEEDDESVASEVRADSIPDETPCDKCKRNSLDCECEADFFASDDEDDTPIAENKVMSDEQVYGLAYATIAALQAEVATLKAQLQDAKDDMKDMVASLKGIIGNQQYRDQTAEAQPIVRDTPVRHTPVKGSAKPKAKAPAPVVEQPEGKRYTYKRPMTYEGDYCKEGMVVEMSIKRLWVEGIAMRLAYYPSAEGNWLGLNAQWRGRRFLNLQRASTECCEKNQIANSPNAWAAFRCINPKDDEYISIERLDKHPNWADCKVLMDDQYWDEEGNLREADEEDEDA
jgi:uncharacterized small protein (DUF1192 family)